MKEIIFNLHGNSIFRIATDLGVDYMSIISHYEDRVGYVPPEPVATMFRCPPLSREIAADLAYNEIVKTCKAIYFGRLSREEATTISDAITRVGYLYLADDLRYNSYEFEVAWDDAHPDQEPIRGIPGSSN